MPFFPEFRNHPPCERSVERKGITGRGKRIEPDDDGEYAGAYWTGTEMVVAGELGTDLDEALDEFRELLRQRGEL